MDEQKIHHLLQLKNYEYPSSEMVEEFISEFHRRQDNTSSCRSFFNELKEQISFFFSDLPIPRIAYVAATAVALGCSIIILQTKSSVKNENDSASSLLCSDNFSAIHYYSSPIIEKSEEKPVSFDESDKDNDSIFFSISHLLQKKSSEKQSLMSL
ncbi:MAG: hypothetical protein K9M81_04810 [Chthoniobacterales bacterium]|nr:hypothetical protein [Chthoniobacterales bacterium]